eukprot:492646_1
MYVLLCFIGLASADINLNLYGNTVLDGKPSKVIALNSLNYSFPNNNEPFSAQILGTISWSKSVDKYYIKCVGTGLDAIVKIDDHLICAPNIYPDPIFEYWNLSWTASAYNTRQSFVRIDIYSTGKNNNLDLNVLWSFNNDSNYQIIPGTSLSSTISSDQQTRMTLQNNLTYNSFSTWYTGNMLTVVRMPDSFGFTFGICNGANDTQCIMQDIIENNNLWVGLHAYDHSYYEYNETYTGYNIGYQYSSIPKNKTYSNLYAKVTLLSTKTPLPFVSVASRFYWDRSGNIASINTNNGDLNCFQKLNGYGLPQTFEICSSSKVTKISNGNTLFQFDANNNAIYFTTDTNINSVTDIDVIINKYMTVEYATYNKYGLYNDTKKGIQAGLMWNEIYTPEESGPYFPVARSWAHAGPGNDFGMVLFDWDNIFASYQLSMDALDLSISNLLQVIKSKTCHGFIPNYKWTRKANVISSSEDRTEPPIGAMVLNKMYKKYGNNILWVIRLLFDDLYDWVNWFWIQRRCLPKNLICLGSDPSVPDVNRQQNNMQAARYESGLDNSPMYDGNLFNTTTHHMQLYDVGMTGMYMNELKCLMNLGKAINIGNEVLNILNERYNFMLNLTLNELWDDSIGIFANKFSTNDTFYPRISPTLFYPLLTGDVDVKKVEMMVTNYLLNEN